MITHRLDIFWNQLGGYRCQLAVFGNEFWGLLLPLPTSIFSELNTGTVTESDADFDYLDWISLCKKRQCERVK